VLEPGCNERPIGSSSNYSRFEHGLLDGTVVNVALPALQSALRATLADVQWVVESYALFLATLLLVGGSLGDTYRRRKKTSDHGYPVPEHVKHLVDDKIVWAPAIDEAFVLPMRGVDFEKATRAGEKLSRMHSLWATALGCG
jgi:hypothetical protein